MAKGAGQYRGQKVIMQIMKFGQRRVKADKSFLMPSISTADVDVFPPVFQRLNGKL
jgi:hypothetical protein